MNDKAKKPLFQKHFKHWGDPTNNHERDAALLGYWWCCVAFLDYKPLWNLAF